MVILNEGFKKLYGFDDKTHKKSEWKRLFCYIKSPVTNEYQEVKVYDIMDYKNRIMEVEDINTGLIEYINVDRLKAYDKTVIGITFNGESYYNLRIYINDDKGKSN